MEQFKKRFVYALIITGIVGVLGLVYVFTLTDDLPSLRQLENFDPNLITRIYSRDGEIIKELYTQRRVLVPLDQIPEYMEQALLSAEDQRFYDHWGVNVFRIMKAAVTDLLALSWEEGASTLTQQLARNLYETIGFEKSLTRKIKEAITSIKIERTYTKHEILEMYLNSIYFGHGVYGIEAAAKKYYNKHAKNLDLAQCATLVGILPGPAPYSPLNHPDRAQTRRNIVLRAMHEQGFVADSTYQQIAASPIKTNPPKNEGTGIAPYFAEYIRKELERISETLDLDPYRDGLSIYTTLDTRLQAEANAAYKRFIEIQQKKLDRRLLRDAEELRSLVNTDRYNLSRVREMIRGEIPMDSTLYSELKVQGALVSIEPRTGHILAMIGGREFSARLSEAPFNRATQARRQPGSAFKPFLYTTAVDNGYPVTKQLLNQPVVIFLDDTTRWTPQNYDRTTGGLMTLREGLKHSKNLIAVRVVQELVPPSQVVNYAHRMGITTHLRPVNALALGTSEVIPLEITAAYGVFPNHGIWVQPQGITRIEDRYGNVLKEYQPLKREVLSEQTAYIMVDMLQGVMNGGTGSSARWKWDFQRPAGGKTGTTQNFTDAWFVGYTPQMVTGVWVGVDNPAVSLGNNESGARAALPMWATYMDGAHDTLDLPIQEFQKPEGVVNLEICRVTKSLPTQYCPIEKEIFNEKYVPNDTCTLHGPEGNNRRNRHTF